LQNFDLLLFSRDEKQKKTFEYKKDSIIIIIFQTFNLPTINPNKIAAPAYQYKHNLNFYQKKSTTTTQFPTSCKYGN
jgi:hypothetical protein